jgi:enamine deaminase RidA (YjgF/YER057c/UK114 family)
MCPSISLGQKPMPAKRAVKELGLPLPGPPRPAGRFVPAVQTGNLIFVSGQISAVSVELELIVEVQS